MVFDLYYNELTTEELIDLKYEDEQVPVKAASSQINDVCRNLLRSTTVTKQWYIERLTF